MTPRLRRDPSRRAWGLISALFIVLLLASTSASSRIWRSSLDTGPTDVPTLEVVDSTPTDTLAPEVADNDPGSGTGGETAWAIMQTVLLSMLLISLVWAAIVLRSLWRRVQWHEPGQEPTFPVLPDVATAITDDATAQLDALATGSPRNAIVACWVRLEDAVASIGIERHPSETAAELTSRVLSRYAGGRDAIDELARLYREARFSVHDLGEPERDRAIAALRQLHEELGLIPAGAASGSDDAS